MERTFNWQRKKVRDMIEDFERGVSYTTADIKGGDILLLNLACIDKQGYYREGELKNFGGDFSDNHVVYPGDMLIACTDLTRNADIVGTPIWVPQGDFYLYTMDLAKLTPKKNVDKSWLYYALKTPSYRNYIKKWASGSNVLHLNLKGVYEYIIDVPPIEQQRRIGKLLSDIDRKIALNRRMNATLEAMARQLYDYWFLQFDFPDAHGKPYKSSGGKMTWNDKLKRDIPEGWSCGTLLDIAEYTNGLACQKFRPTSADRLPVIKIKEMHEGLSADTEWVKSDIPEAVKVYDGDVLFSWSASLEVMLWAYGKGGLNQHIFKVTSKNGYPRSFYYYQLLKYIGVFKRMAEARKTTMGHITQDHLKQSTIALPPNVDVANRLEEKLCPIFDSIVKNNQEIMHLTRLRTTLLPLLMNGQVSVAEP